MEATLSQTKSGLFYAEIRHDDGDLSSCLASTPAEAHAFLISYGIAYDQVKLI